ncbi:hypothetical protein G6F35_013526 [Rhizopus arrhizus]|nr:hypothetical protein G6F35_013526 [Rhizopus arrhizus]
MIPGRLAIGPRVRRAAGALGVAQRRVQVIGQLFGPVAARLVEHGLAVGQRNEEAVAEATHAGEGAEVAVEGTVFQHQHPDVLDVLDGAGRAAGFNGQGAADAGREHRQGAYGGRGSQRGLEELSL